jgi:rRNA maturation endonuclease Nob1
VEIDDGDLDEPKSWLYDKDYCPFKYQEENKFCAICGENCTKNKTRQYLEPPIDRQYPNT